MTLGSMDIVEGSTLDDRYELARLIGTGGMSEVWLARDTPRFGAEELPESILREASVLASLHHPGIVSVVDAGVHRGQPYIVMEYVEGRSHAEDSGTGAGRRGRWPAWALARASPRCWRLGATTAAAASLERTRPHRRRRWPPQPRRWRPPLRQRNRLRLPRS